MSALPPLAERLMQQVVEGSALLNGRSARERQGRRAADPTARVGRRESDYKRHLDAVALALHPHWREDGRQAYDPAQLAGMVDALRAEIESLEREVEEMRRDVRSRMLT